MYRKKKKTLNKKKRNEEKITFKLMFVVPPFVARSISACRVSRTYRDNASAAFVARYCHLLMLHRMTNTRLGGIVLRRLQLRNASNESKVNPKEIAYDNSTSDYTRLLQFFPLARKFFDTSFCPSESPTRSATTPFSRGENPTAGPDIGVGEGEGEEASFHDIFLRFIRPRESIHFPRSTVNVHVTSR